MTEAATVERQENPVGVLRHQLGNMDAEFRAALPAHIPVERFGRILMTACQNNPELIECERRSLWNAAMKAAQDGLLPDGREGAMVVRRDPNRGKIVVWQTMIAGVRKKARNSGEIATWDAHVVRAGDNFQFQLGDNPQINHSYDLSTERGEIIGAYSVCLLQDGSKSYEVMSISEIHAIRDKTDAWKAFQAGKIRSTPWADHEGEMCRKTVARRHSKVLPMSTDLDDLIRRDDELYDLPGARDDAQQLRPRSLAGRLDTLARLPEPEGAAPAPEPPADAPADRPSPELAAETEAPPPAVDDEPELPPLDLIPGLREAQLRGRTDAAKGLRRFAPTKLSPEEQEVYLAEFDAERERPKGV